MPPSAASRELADQKAEIFDEDIMAIVSNEAQHDANEHYRFISLSQRSETGERPHARVVFNMDGQEHSGEGEGNGPVDATLHAIESQVNSGAEMVLYSVNAITGGTEAQGEVTVRLSKAGRIVNGVGTDSGHRGGFGQGLSGRAEQAARQGRAEDQPADLILRPASWRR
ncbi:alpha-isopropylmalate synthase regulatory domain-containing protein [Cupriavidus basilensis]